MAISAQTGYIVPRDYETYHVRPGTRETHHKTMKQYIKPKNHKHSSAWALWRWSSRHD